MTREEKVDPVKAKRTLAALTKPPKSPSRGNYERILAKTYAEAERSGSIVSDRRLKERRAGKKIAQLGEQANQSCPPLKVSKDIVANDPSMVPGYSNLGDYLPDDVHYEIMEVDEHKYHYGKPLVKDERSLTTMMRRLHDWYMKTCRESDGMDTLTLRVKSEHDLVGIDLLNVSFEDFFQFYNQKALDKTTITCYCLLKIAELKKRQIGDIGFINTNLIDAYTVEKHPKEAEANLLQSLVLNQNKDIILFPYNFNFHYILLEIKLEQGVVTVLDSRRNDPQDYANMTQMLEKVWRKFTSKAPGLPKKLQFNHPKWLWQEPGNNYCGYYVCESIRYTTCERGYTEEQYEMFWKRDELLAPDRMRGIQEELAAFFLDHVIAENGEYYVDPMFLQFN
ncbi:uncharacterized protein [Aegilops tauschii subsp. strangulata]|uniref:uncharacterized protein n=1 Tax=Aegilops tauschii subsp. strangulata TaxID=200361 RepID=UPI003CC865E1